MTWAQYLLPSPFVLVLLVLWFGTKKRRAETDRWLAEKRQKDLDIKARAADYRRHHFD